MHHILIVGLGKLGQPLAQQLIAAGHRVSGVRRSAQASGAHLNCIAADVTDAASLQALHGDFTLAVIILPPAERTETAYRAIYHHGVNNLLARFAHLPTPPPCLLVSSTSVFSECSGAVVDEHTPPNPRRANARWLLSAEQAVHHYRADSTVVRFSGIYGGQRRTLQKRLLQTPQVQKTPPYYTNRIHQDDCVGVLFHLTCQRLAGKPLAPLYIASDQDSATKWELACWLAARYHYPQPTALHLPPDAAQNKRCSCQRLLDSGYTFKFPSFREGYDVGG